MGAYLAMLIASLFIGPSTALPNRRLAWGAMLLLAGATAGSAVWFIIVQKWGVGAFCPYCMAAHITGLLLAALVVWQVIVQFDGDAADVEQSISRQRAMGPLLASGLALGGLGLAVVLAVCQIAFAPPIVYRSGEVRNIRPVIDPHSVPLVGSPNAPYVVTLMFDYKCPHCRLLHSMLDEAIHRYNGKLAFALCPAPLNNQCNPYISRKGEEFKDSCELARLGLAVWVADREAFAEFDRWMFSPEPGDVWPRSLDAARAKAIELVGQTKFDAARIDPWVDAYMQTSIRIFGDSIRFDPNSNAVPKLIFGTRWVTAELNNADELVLTLRDKLAVRMQ